jgi:hypothetical protein
MAKLVIFAIIANAGGKEREVGVWHKRWMAELKARTEISTVSGRLLALLPQERLEHCIYTVTDAVSRCLKPVLETE